MLHKTIKNTDITISNILLLIFTFILIFLIPLIPASIQSICNSIIFSIIFILAVFALSKARKTMVYIAIIAFITQWIAEWLKIEVLRYISFLTNIIFFQIIVIKLIIQIARSKHVSAKVILESINVYLLLGLVFSTLIAVLHLYNPNAFSFPKETPVTLQDIIYFTYVTMTTTGYGDITPQVPLARSLSILISICGQLYIAIIIAMLVGKFAGSQFRSSNK